ncbi:PleD family two-component system response regulator [Candidatus Omnitrophota bacterium]
MEKKRIMVVDDEVDFLTLIKINLETTGKYEVMTLSNSLDIIPKMQAFKPNIILLDILMPKMDGVEACKMLNADSIGKGIPIIMLSALDTDQDKLMMYKLGVIDFLVKPIEIDELIARIEKALKQ